MMFRQSHIATGRVNSSLYYRTLCGRVVNIWGIVGEIPWWCMCKVCRKKHKETSQ